MNSKNYDEWRTREEDYKKYNDIFKFDFDPCPYNAKENGLTKEWGYRNYVNPPFSHIDIWIEKGKKEAAKGKLIVFLLPAWTDSAFFQDNVKWFDYVCFLKERIGFKGIYQNLNYASFGIMLCILGELNKYEIEELKKLGVVFI